MNKFDGDSKFSRPKTMQGLRFYGKDQMNLHELTSSKNNNFNIQN